MNPPTTSPNHRPPHDGTGRGDALSRGPGRSGRWCSTRPSATPVRRSSSTTADTGFRSRTRTSATIVTEIARGLIALGIEQGDRVAILGATSAEWTMADYGALCAGAVVTPIYHTNSPEECAYVLAHSGARLVFCEDPAQAAKIAADPRSLSGARAGRAVRRRRRRCAVVAAAAQARPGRDRRRRSTCGSRRPTRTTSRRSSTRPARPGRRRAACSRHANFLADDADVRRSARDQRDAHDVPVPAARARARAGRAGGGASEPVPGPASGAATRRRSSTS